MPFPLNSLPYGFRRRLNELSTPFEAYQLQKAAPNFTKRVQKVTILPEIDIIDDSITTRYPPMTDNDTLYALNNISTIKNSTNLDLTFKRILFLTHSLCFEKCHFNKESVKIIYANLQLNPATENEESIVFFDSCTFDDDVTPEYFCTVFKCFENIVWNPLPSKIGWLDGIFNSNITGLRRLCVTLMDSDALIIDKNKFLKFFLAQSDQFEFRIDIDCLLLSLARPKISALMDANFWKVNPSSTIIGKCVIFRFCEYTEGLYVLDKKFTPKPPFVSDVLHCMR